MSASRELYNCSIASAPLGTLEATLKTNHVYDINKNNNYIITTLITRTMFMVQIKAIARVHTGHLNEYMLALGGHQLISKAVKTACRLP